MSSTHSVDFSVRQNKSIERLIVFEGLHRLIAGLELTDLVYVGLGSVWFTDFVLAHRELGIETMYSVESDPIVFKRAVFNKPYRTLEVREGPSADVIPRLLSETELKSRPWIVWLDYDKDMDDSRLDELKYLIENLPENSTLLTTFNARPGRYGALADRVRRLQELFGDALREGLHNPDVKDERLLMEIMAEAVSARLVATALQYSRPGGFEPAFSLGYQDSTPMVTVGGFLPTPGTAKTAHALIRSGDWGCRVPEPIMTPPLTAKEIAALQRQLPRDIMLTRAEVQSLGFDLAEEQIESFVTHYLNYPTFAQIAR